MSVSLAKFPVDPSPSTGDVTPYPNAVPSDSRETMPKGGYRFGMSNSALRPTVPKGQ